MVSKISGFKHKLKVIFPDPAFYKILLWLFVILGIIFRLRQFLFNRSLWSDEALLANNFLFLSPYRLIRGSLVFDQAAPSGFLILVFLVTKLFGLYDYTLRFIPIVSAILSVVLAYYLSKYVYKTFVGQLVFVGSISISPILIYYSSEFKQYSSDLFVTLLILWASYSSKTRKNGNLFLGLLGAICIWFSIPSVIVLASVGTVMLLELLIQNKKKEAFQLLGVIVFWLVNFGLFFLFTLRNTASNTNLVVYWRGSFAPLLPNSIQALRWYPESLLGLTYLSFWQSFPRGPGPIELWFSLQNFLLLGIVVFGGVYAFLRSRKIFLIGTLMIIINLSLSAFHLYPFSNRLLLYLTPVVYLFAGMFFEGLFCVERYWLKIVTVVTTSILLIATVKEPIKVAIQPNNFSDIKTALKIVARKHVPNDNLITSVWGRAPFDFYRRFYQLNDVNVVQIKQNDDRAIYYVETLCNQKVLGRTWILFIFTHVGEKELLESLKDSARLIDTWNVGDPIYLFNINNLDFCAQ